MNFAKPALIWTLAAAATACLIYLAVGPNGALYGHPLACVGVALIALGLIKTCADRRAGKA